MLQKFRERLTLFLIAVLPLHALLVTVWTKWILGPGQAPMTGLALWKEGVLGIILFLGLIEFLQSFKIQDSKFKIQIDWIDSIILLLLALSIGLFATGYPSSLTSFVYGFKYDFVPLVAFLILRRVKWRDDFFDQVKSIILFVGGLVAGFGVLTLFVPGSFFKALGYSDLHSLYVPGGPLAPYQQIGATGIRRIQSTMSGPNQLGLWLLLPWTFGVFAYLKCQQRRFLKFIPLPLGKTACNWTMYMCLIGMALFFTFSRAAWIAGFFILLFALWHTQKKEEFTRSVIRISTVFVAVILLLLMISPESIVRVASSRDHIRKPLAAIGVMYEHPLGLGLGTAGPASNRVSDTCVHLEEGADTSWAENHPHLCVFTGDTKVQPEDRECHCPLLPENWYLQIGVELGVLGFILFVTLVLLLCGKLKKHPELLSIFIGISIAALVLHSWEGAAVAYTVWLLLATRTIADVD